MYVDTYAEDICAYIVGQIPAATAILVSVDDEGFGLSEISCSGKLVGASTVCRFIEDLYPDLEEAPPGTFGELPTDTLFWVDARTGLVDRTIS